MSYGMDGRYKRDFNLDRAIFGMTGQHSFTACTIAVSEVAEEIPTLLLIIVTLIGQKKCSISPTSAVKV